MKKTYGFLLIMLIALGFTTSPSKVADAEGIIKKITEQTPLVLRHADNLFDDVVDYGNYHRSHSSHMSHRSHSSHYSSY